MSKMFVTHGRSDRCTDTRQNHIILIQRTITSAKITELELVCDRNTMLPTDFHEFLLDGFGALLQTKSVTKGQMEDITISPSTISRRGIQETNSIHKQSTNLIRQ